MIGRADRGSAHWYFDMTETRFRQLLAIYLVVLVAAFVLAFLPPAYSETLKAAYEAEPESWLIHNVWLSMPLLVLSVVGLCSGFVGLYLFKSWGRSLSLAMTVLGTVITLLIGPNLTSPLEDAVGETLAFLWGAILAAAFWSPVAHRFSKAKGDGGN